MIKILDDNEENVLNKYKREEVLVKIEPDQTVGATADRKRHEKVWAS